MQAIVRVHSEGEPNFSTQACGYPAPYVDQNAEWDDAR